MEHRQPVYKFMELVTEIFDILAEIPNAELFVVSILPRPKIEYYDWYVMHQYLLFLKWQKFNILYLLKVFIFVILTYI